MVAVAHFGRRGVGNNLSGQWPGMFQQRVPAVREDVTFKWGLLVEEGAKARYRDPIRGEER